MNRRIGTSWLKSITSLELILTLPIRIKGKERLNASIRLQWLNKTSSNKAYFRIRATTIKSKSRASPSWGWKKDKDDVVWGWFGMRRLRLQSKWRKWPQRWSRASNRSRPLRTHRKSANSWIKRMAIDPWIWKWSWCAGRWEEKNSKWTTSRKGWCLS